MNREFVCFTIISGVISFCYNVVMIVVPLRMTDHGMNYAMVGTAMSAVAVGLMIIKLLIGHLSDRLGTRRFILTSLAGLCVVSFFLARANNIFQFGILLAAIGIFRGIFLSVNGSYVLSLSENDGYGKVYGTVQGISSILASIGGMISGVLYVLNEGEYALYICGFLLFVGIIGAIKRKKKNECVYKERLPIKKVLSSINKQIFIFCIIVFVQSFVAGTMWNFIIPVYCYDILLLSPAVVGVLMSLDELISSPTYIVAGNIVDKVNVVKFNIVFLLVTALGGFLMMKATSITLFVGFFLLCSISISCTLVGIPKERIEYINKNQKGFELAFISMCGSLGDSFGSSIMGNVAEKLEMQYCMLIFAITYICMAIFVILPAIKKKRNKNAE